MSNNVTAIIDNYKIKSKVGLVDQSTDFYLQGFIYQHDRIKDGKYVTAFIKRVVKESDGEILYHTNMGVLRGGNIVGPDKDEGLVTAKGYLGMICGTSVTLPMDSRNSRCFGLVHKGIAVNCGSGIVNFLTNLTTRTVNLFLPCTENMVMDYAYAPALVSTCLAQNMDCTVWVPSGSSFNAITNKVIKRSNIAELEDVTVYYGLGYIVCMASAGGVLAYINSGANPEMVMRVIGGKRIDTLIVQAGVLSLENIFMLDAEQVLVSDYVDYKVADEYTKRLTVADIQATTAVEGLLFSL